LTPDTPADPRSLTERLAARLVLPVDAETRTRARLHLLDWLGCVAGALQSPLGRTLGNAAALGNLLEMDDVHRTALLHPGPVVWPVASGEGVGDTLSDRLDAGVRGYEAMIAIGATFDAHHYAHYHPTATAGVFGAAAAEASLLGLDAAHIVNALGNAGSLAGGLWRMRHEAVATKQFHVMRVVDTGIQAARWAELAGPKYIVEGEQGLWAATCAAPGWDRFDTSPDHWRIAEVSFKPWGACRHAHPAIDAALELRAAGKLAGPVTVETYADAITFCDRPAPDSVIAAKFSLQHAVAVVMVRGEPALADFEPAAIADVDIAAARTQVSVTAAPDITARYPAHFGARLTAGGTTVERIDTRGDPERPLDCAGVIAKARALLAWGGVAPALADEAVDFALNADDAAPGIALADLVDRIVAA
jgi:2-methylcitrate dehydratase PrpD